MRRLLRHTWVKLVAAYVIGEAVAIPVVCWLMPPGMARALAGLTGAACALLALLLVYHLADNHEGD
jgi:hypothetical protein